MRHAAIEERIQADYAKVPIEIRTNVYKAWRWARQRLMRHEGEGHLICLSRKNSQSRLIVCSFSKAWWPGDHSGRAMETGAEAIVISVCEYLNGA